jgi:hypothetical protein
VDRLSLLPRESWLSSFCKAEKARGRRTLVYVRQTGSRPLVEIYPRQADGISPIMTILHRRGLPGQDQIHDALARQIFMRWRRGLAEKRLGQPLHVRCLGLVVLASGRIYWAGPTTSSHKRKVR